MTSRFSNSRRSVLSSKPGFSVLEILIGVLILGLAVIPIFGISSSTTRSAFLVGRHMMAGQVAQSLLEWFIARPYKDALREAQVLSGQTISVTDDLVFRHILHSAAPDQRDQVMNEFRRTFRQMHYIVEHQERTEPQHGRVLTLKVTLLYRLAEDHTEVRRFVISTLKFPEDV